LRCKLGRHPIKRGILGCRAPKPQHLANRHPTPTFYKIRQALHGHAPTEAMRAHLIDLLAKEADYVASGISLNEEYTEYYADLISAVVGMKDAAPFRRNYRGRRWARNSPDAQNHASSSAGHRGHERNPIAKRLNSIA
jgi:hypothetical protein